MNTYETEVKKWEQATHERELAIATLQDEEKKLLCKSVESAAENKRVELRIKRAECLVEIELQAAELTEVTRRFEVASQAVKEHKMTVAQEAYERADKDARAKRDILLAAQKAKLRFMNAGGRKGESDESINQLKKIEVDIATAQAELTIANRHKELAGQSVKELRSSTAVT